MMRVRSALIIAAAGWLAACTDMAGPSRPQDPLLRADGALHQLRWRSNPVPRTFAVVRNTPAEAAMAGAAGAAATLDQNQVSFWAFPDRDQEIHISYLAGDGTWQPYLDFVVPSGALAQWPDGSPILPSDSVLITAQVDTASLVVHFQPTGLVFNPLTPARLTVWYTDANPDFDASGAVDSTDTYIEQTLLGVWVQEFSTAPWSPVTATQYLPGKLFSANLNHFSDYAVSW
jgi:hypothetical protein